LKRAGLVAHSSITTVRFMSLKRAPHFIKIHSRNAAARLSQGRICKCVNDLRPITRINKQKLKKEHFYTTIHLSNSILNEKHKTQTTERH